EDTCGYIDGRRADDRVVDAETTDLLDGVRPDRFPIVRIGDPAEQMNPRPAAAPRHGMGDADGIGDDRQLGRFTETLGAGKRGRARVDEEGVAGSDDLHELAGNFGLAGGGLVHSLFERSLGDHAYAPRAAMNLQERSGFSKQRQIAADRFG